ncbi:hypothetical protein HAINFHK1212_1447, partial [Haemophilus influenzae HK1212]
VKHIFSLKRKGNAGCLLEVHIIIAQKQINL